MSVSDHLSVLPTDIYTRKAVIGRGAFSVVWLAQASGGFGEQVVVKDVALEAMSEEDRESAISEVVLHSQLNHRNIVR
jgi:serine/threonine protein kinase